MENRDITIEEQKAVAGKVEELKTICTEHGFFLDAFHYGYSTSRKFSFDLYEGTEPSYDSKSDPKHRPSFCIIISWDELLKNVVSVFNKMVDMRSRGF